MSVTAEELKDIRARAEALLDERDGVQSEPAAPTTAAVPGAPSIGSDDLADIRRRAGELLDEQDAALLQRGRAVQGVASQYQPEAYAEAVKLGREFGIDAKTVADNPEPYRQESKKRAAQGIMKDAPATREWLTNLDNAAVAQDDIENLSNLERGVQRVSDTVRSLGAGAPKAIGMGVSGTGRLLSIPQRAVASGVDTALRAIGADTAADFLQKPLPGVQYLDPVYLLRSIGGSIESDADVWAPPVERQNLATDIAGGLGQIVAQVGVAFANPAASLGMLLGQGADIQGDRADAAGASQQDTDLAVLWGAAITAITEKYQLDELLKLVPSGMRMSIFQRLKSAAVAGFGEAAQEVTEGIGQNIAAKTIYEPDAEIFEGLEREALAAGGAGAIAKVLIDAIVPGKARSNPRADRETGAQIARIEQLRTQFQAAQRGEAAGELGAELVRLAGETALAERSPEQLESFAKAVKEKAGVETAYIDAAAFRTLYQSDDEANRAANELTGGQNTYYEAAISGSSIAVPIEKFIAKVAPQLADAKVEGKRFTDFVSFDPEGLNANEASAQRDALFEEAKKAAEREAVEGATDSSQAIYDDNLAQLVAAGMEKRTAEFNAALTRSTFRALATRAGMDPLQLYQRYQLKVRSRFEGQPPDAATELTQDVTEDVTGPASQPGDVTAGYTGPGVERAGLVQSILGGGVTYQPVTGNQPQAGQPGAYSVSPFPERGVILAPEEVSVPRIIDFLLANRDLLSQADNYFGAWFDQQTNKVFFDVSIVVPTREQAVAASVKHRQIAYFDFETMQSVDVDPALRQEYVPDAAARSATEQATREDGDGARQGSAEAGQRVQDVRGPDGSTADARGEGGSASVRATEGAGAVTDSPAFKRWFGRSTVVDENGKPRVVYHGTGKDFDAFDLSKIQRPGFGYGFHFAEDVGVANFYSEQWSDGNRGTGDVVMPAYLSIQRPFTGDYYSYLAEHGNDHKAAREALIAEGYDGIRYSHNRKGDAWVAFYPSQIKSATGNRGTFDPASENILFQDDADQAPVWVSALTRAAEAAKIKKGTAEQWMGSLRNMGGVKPEELESTDLEAWLKSLGRAATKEEVVEYLRANQLVIDDLVGTDADNEMDDRERARLARRIENAARYMSESLAESEDNHVNTEPTVVEDKFTHEVTLRQEDFGHATADLFTGEVEPEVSYVDVPLAVRVTEVDSNKNWRGADRGWANAVVSFPDGRSIHAGVDFSVDTEDGSIGDISAFSRSIWDERDFEFTDEEIDAVKEALDKIEISPGEREFNPKLQEDINEYESDMARAAESLREGDIEDARKYLAYGASFEREQGDDEGTASEVLELLGEESERGTKHDQWTMPGGEDYTEFKLILPQIEPKFTSSTVHWPSNEKNIVAFVRFKTRTDTDGKRVLFIEEIQSDWHAAGREKGYIQPTPPYQPVDKLPQGWTWKLISGNVTLYDQDGAWNGARSAPYDQDEASLEARAIEMYNDRQRLFSDRSDSFAVPDAPFKTTWRELAFKRMIRYAADNNFDRIAWTPGQVQAERYDRTNFVDEIRVLRAADGSFSWNARKDSQATDLANGTAKSAAELGDYIGKDLAKKAAALEPEQEQAFRGEELRIDNTGLVGLYDRIIPGEVAKLVKKWGGKVGTTRLKPDRGAIDANDVGDATEAVAMGREPVPSVDITPAMREAALAGLPMFQRGATTIEGDTAGKRGSITWGTDRKFTINLFEKRDLSTYLHESGHLYLEVLGDLAEDGNAPQQIKDDYAALLKWFGVADRAGIKTEQHEQFARGFEAYLAEGKAPSVELQPVFFRFRQWMLAVYKAIRNLGSTPGSIGAALNVSLTDEVRAVMDRMLATDEQIAEAEQAQQYAPIFTNAEIAGMSPAEWKAYREIIDRAHRESVDELTGRAMAELTREKKKWWREELAKVTAEVTAEANASPVYRAIAFLTKGKNADGSALTEGTPTFKLSKADIDARFGKDVRRKLPRGSVAEDGITAETAAQALGFPSGADMVRILSVAPAKKAAIKQVADARMRERHGDMMLDGSMVEQAIDSVHTEGRAKVLAAELKALKRKQAEVKDFVAGATKAQNDARRQAREANEASLPARDEMRVIREAAQRAIAAKKIRTISPQLYRAAERRAAKRAFEMAGKGKFEDAYLAKRQQILNYELYRAAVAARTQVDKQVEYMRRFDTKKVRERLAAAKGQYLEQIDALRQRFDFTQQPANADLKRDALAKWVDEQIAAGREVAIPQWVIDEARTTPYKELTAAELEGLVDAAKNIEHLAKTKDRLLRNRKEAQFQQAKAELLAQARASLKGGKAPPVSQFEEGWSKRARRFAAGLANGLLRAETLTEWLDGGKSGPWHDFLMEPANNAEYAREDLRTKILAPMAKLANSIDKARREELEQFITLDTLGVTFNRRTVISIALNMGNASNIERLLKGGFRDIKRNNETRLFTPESLQEITRKLTLKDWQFIQEMWNTAESLWPEMLAFQKRMGGLVPEKIPATPVVTPVGTFAGGYWPAVYDSLASEAGAEQADSAKALGILMGANFTRASTSKSALQSRTGAGGPLLLDFSAVMGRHLDQVITDITHREFAIQAMRILDDPQISATLQDTIGEDGWNSLKSMVASTIQQDGASDAATKWYERLRRRMISNLAVAALGFKVVTAFGNLVMAPLQAGARVKPTYILKGIAKYASHPNDSREFVDASSSMMRNRAQNMDASFTAIREKLEGRNNILAETQRAAMSIHQTADRLATTGIWMGAYMEAIDSRADHAEAVRLADKAIRQTQTAGAPKDLSAFERNPAYRELKLFIGPMIIMHNRMREAAGAIRQGKRGVIQSWPEGFGVLLATYMLPAILWDIVNGRGPDDDDDDGSTLDEFLPWALRKLIFYPMATVPYLRDVGSLIEREWSGKFAEARMTPAADAAMLLYKAGAEFFKQFSDADDDDSDDVRKVAQAALRASGPAFGVPSAAADTASAFVLDVWNGDYEIENAGDLRYLLTRRPKED